ncbi:MAG: Flp pilus assembly protein CpaB [Silicimonas sp.]|nr:Flp pilus assembly protein CpaB [Silicimonas sp.]NNF92747.1 Flp pilus assembly protein CpaB [Boseongicola sp.]RZW10191.1 MAG: Flp pilus assembly protein CpaB [Paracoccaceae bacterium]MBT8426185.1 Flp pilus assembly protein CpaB [Silicimonas sp.]NND18060.1 Flp pilus assembly protein CpaB [Silicimonas sp.]
MRLVFGFVLLVGIGLAGSAVYLAKDYIGQQQAQLAEAEAAKLAIVPTADVYVVNKQMRYGQRLTMDDVKQVRWPVEAIPEGAFASEEELFPKGSDILRSILRTMEPNEAVMAVKVTEPGQDAGVSSRLSPGMRAFAVRTDVTSGVSGFLRPGDRVDVYWTGQLDGGQNLTRLIESSIRIIAIDQSADEDRNSPTVARTVTVEINPAQVASLAQAQATGRLSLSLVGADDATVSSTVEVDLKDVLGIEEERVVEAPQEQKCFVRRRQGEETISVEIPCSN